MVNFLVKVNYPLARQRLPAMQIDSEILRVFYLHRNEFTMLYRIYSNAN